ncbi:hypothetical protein L610_002500000650 [Aminobacter sp. J44]|nr:hypothetical protein L610_002500000650 [Aminobacter sp. J44]
MTRFWCRGLTLPTTERDVALVSPVSCCASTSSYPGSTGVSMPERFRLISGEEQGRPPHLFARPSLRCARARSATDEHGSECATAGSVEMFRHGSPARARFAGLAGMTKWRRLGEAAMAARSPLPLVILGQTERSGVRPMDPCLNADAPPRLKPRMTKLAWCRAIADAPGLWTLAATDPAAGVRRSASPLRRFAPPPPRCGGGSEVADFHARRVIFVGATCAADGSTSHRLAELSVSRFPAHQRARPDPPPHRGGGEPPKVVEGAVRASR